MRVTAGLLVNARALTLWRWWAYAVTHLGKRVENRPWMPPDDTDVVLIHAGAPRHLTDERGDQAAIRRLALADGASLPTAVVLPETVPSSSIVAVARLAHVCDAGVRSARCGCGPWAAAGHYHWRFADDLAVLAVPVPARGYQKLWHPNAPVREQVLTDFRLAA